MKAFRHVVYRIVFVAIVGLSFTCCAGSTRAKPPEATYRAADPFMQMSIEEARDGIYNGDGGPFGCVVVKDGEVVGKGHNRVLAHKDSTSHGEMEAIRAAEKGMGTYDLTGCVLYTTGEPCTMCLAAIGWANIQHVYYGCTLEDNSDIGFRDARMNELLGGRESVQGFMEELDRDACLELFQEYDNMDAVVY